MHSKEDAIMEKKKKLRPMMDNRTLEIMIEDEQKFSAKRAEDILSNIKTLLKRLKTRSNSS